MRDTNRQVYQTLAASQDVAPDHIVLLLVLLLVLALVSLLVLLHVLLLVLLLFYGNIYAKSTRLWLHLKTPTP